MTNELSADAASEDLFQAMPREATLANRVTQEIEQLIVDGRLKTGKRIPSERDLAGQFGVSRTVVREAVRGLVAKGLLEVKPGSGTMVRTPSARSITQSMSLFLRAHQADLSYDKIHEVRRILEIEIAGLAAARRMPEDLATLEQILERMADMRADPERFPQLDVLFHAALAAATHNELFALLLDSIADVMIRVRQMGFNVPDSSLHAIRYHNAIYEQVRAGNAEGARRAMREHLIDSEAVIRQATAMHQQS
jgi:GntR family transcriptional regulator, transcriptional repressor for pyruvate dehydrogenase complex